ncbi:MAG: DNA-binding transcriptional LysR family regulator [Candidatus Azotimanducaceae bacterium]|jgi:DNA-binding transcriptional LysR family regulator
MNVVFVRTFLEVVKIGNLNRAAERLHVTESTVTTRINSLETLLGQKLLIRNRTGAELTSAGFKFMRYAEIMVQSWSQARQELSLSKDFQSVCNVGCHFDLWDAAGQLWVDHMRTNWPQIAMSFWAGNTGDIEKWLANGLIDVALVFDASISTAWKVHKLFDDALIEVATEARGYMDWDPRYVYVDMGSEFRKQHAEAFPLANTPVITISSSRWALDHILTWKGSGYLPRRLVREQLEQGQLFHVENTPTFYRTANLVSHLDISDDWPWFEASIADIKDEMEETLI